MLPLGKDISEGINMRKRSVVSISDNELELDSSIKKRTFIFLKNLEHLLINLSDFP